MFLLRIKEQKVKKVKQMYINPFVTSENSLLADKSFMSGQSEPSHANGTRLEWTDKMNGTLPSHVGHGRVLIFTHSLLHLLPQII